MFKNLEAEMARHDITVPMLADCIGVYERTMRSYLNGETKIPWLYARKIKHDLFPAYDIEYLFEPYAKEEKAG